MAKKYTWILLIAGFTGFAQCWEPQAITANGNVNLAAKTDGTLWAWGWAAGGALGTGVSGNVNLPVQILSGSTWQSVSTGLTNSYAIKADGTLWSWGENVWGQLGNGPGGINTLPTQVGSSTDWAVVSSGFDHAMAIKTDGTLWGWGRNDSGQVGNGTNTNQFFPVQVGTGTWAKVSCGQGFTIALKTDGSLWSWGANGFGMLGNGTSDPSNVPLHIGQGATWTDMAAQSAHAVAIKSDGTLWGWGANFYKQLSASLPETVPNISQLGSHNDWVSVAVGNHTAALKSDHSLWIWGQNQFGQIGNGTTVQSAIPVNIQPQTVWTKIYTSQNRTMAMDDQGQLWGWGIANYSNPSANLQLTPALFECSNMAIEEPAGDGLPIYPNPSSGIIHIKGLSDRNATLLICDVSGRQITAISGSLEEVNLTGLKPGVYLAKIQSGRANTSQKIIIQ